MILAMSRSKADSPKVQHQIVVLWGTPTFGFNQNGDVQYTGIGVWNASSSDPNHTYVFAPGGGICCEMATAVSELLNDGYHLQSVYLHDYTLVK